MLKSVEYREYVRKKDFIFEIRDTTKVLDCANRVVERSVKAHV